MIGVDKFFTMADIETIANFYGPKLRGSLAIHNNPTGVLNVFSIEDMPFNSGINFNHASRDYYTIGLIIGESLIHYASKTLHVKGSCLIFLNPKVAYKWEGISREVTGYYCTFREAFLIEKRISKFSDLPMFVIGGKPSYLLNEAQRDYAETIFRKMLDEVHSSYKYKQDLLVSYTAELIHYALKLEASETLWQHTTASNRIATVFTELLESQFPIQSPRQRFMHRSARDFARQLFVHVNHLNRSIKACTGKTTTLLIAERIAAEAKALLKHTDWNIGDISYCLGFEEPSHFNNFFRKHTSMSPSAFRQI